MLVLVVGLLVVNALRGISLVVQSCWSCLTALLGVNALRGISPVGQSSWSSSRCLVCCQMGGIDGEYTERYFVNMLGMGLGYTFTQ